MDFFWTALFLILVVPLLDGAFRQGADSANWDLRWRALDAAGRARIEAAAKAGGSGEEPITPEELEERDLVVGYRRHQRRRLSYVGLATTSLLAAASVLALTGVVSHSTTGFVVAVVGILSGAWEFLGKRWMNRKPRAVGDPEAPTAQ